MQWIYYGRSISDEVWEVIFKNQWIAGIQIICCIYITFVPFYSHRFACWNKIGPLIHLIAVHLIFIVLPITSMIATSSRYEYIMESRAIGWLTTFGFINLMTIVYYFVMVLKIVRGAWRFIRSEKEKEDEEPANYFNLWRGQGEGPIRIGTKIDIG